MSKSISIDQGVHNKTILIQNIDEPIIDGKGMTISKEGGMYPNIVFDKCLSPVVRNITVVGDSDNQSERTLSQGIVVNDCDGTPRIENVKLINHGHVGIEGSRTASLHIQGCDFHNPDVLVKRYGNYSFGAYSTFGGNTGWVIEDCAFERIGTCICLWYDSNNITIRNNTMSRIIGQHGIYLSAASNIIISGNEINDPVCMAIKLQAHNLSADYYAGDVHIENNICRQYGRGYGPGILVTVRDETGCWQDITIKNNTVTGFAKGAGIELIRANDYKCIDNCVYNCLSNYKTTNAVGTIS